LLQNMSVFFVAAAAIGPFYRLIHTCPTAASDLVSSFACLDRRHLRR
jgi:hypothetical protein